MSKYVNPTGPGYQGVAKVGDPLAVQLSVGMYDVEWDGNTEVYAVIEHPGIALFASDHRPPEFIRTLDVTVPMGSEGPKVGLPGSVLAQLDVDPGDDVRVYRRELGGLYVVPADPDPFLEADDG